MAWTGSGYFTQTYYDILTNEIAVDVLDDTYRVALLDSTGGIDFTVGADYSDFTGMEVSGPGWAAGGVVLTNKTYTKTSGGVLVLDADDISESGTTLSDIAGCLVYNTTVGNVAMFALDFEGSFVTTSGTLTISWDADGIERLILVP